MQGVENYTDPLIFELDLLVDSSVLGISSYVSDVTASDKIFAPKVLNDFLDFLLFEIRQTFLLKPFTNLFDNLENLLF